LYAKVISTYRQKDSAALKRVSEILLKTYPQSVFADRAIYLNAHLAFENSNDALALSECEKIIHNYPNAHKLVSTYFLEALILKKKGRVKEARNVLNEIQAFYPGSPEAFRTPVELKLLSLQAKAAM
jgi:TolA-binding protein